MTASLLGSVATYFSRFFDQFVINRQIRGHVLIVTHRSVCNVGQAKQSRERFPVPGSNCDADDLVDLI